MQTDMVFSKALALAPTASGPVCWAPAEFHMCLCELLYAGESSSPSQVKRMILWGV